MNTTAQSTRPLPDQVPASQLPASNEQFIAYATSKRIADPLGGEDAVTVRPQCLVRYYRGIKIKEITSSRDGADDTVRVVFDAESVGLKENFGGYMNTGDPVIDYLRERLNADQPVDVGCETVRRAREKSGEKAKIAPEVPIHSLRGANSPDGTGESGVMMGAGGKNVHNVIGLVDGYRPVNAKSNPHEWGQLVGNDAGQFAPAGWKVLVDKEDWRRVGTIVPKGDEMPAPATAQAPQGTQAPAPAAQGAANASLDYNALSGMIRSAVQSALRDHDRESTQADTASNAQPSNRTSGRVQPEPRQWVPWAAKDVPNLGAYAVTGEGYAFRWAAKYLREHLGDLGENAGDVIAEAALELAEAQQDMADAVLETLYGGRVRANRMDQSHREAALWVRFVITEFQPFTEDSSDEWRDAVVAQAVALYGDAANRAQKHLCEQKPATSPHSPEPQQGEGDRAPVLTSFLQVLGHAWGSKDQLLNMATQARDRGFMDTQVWADVEAGKFSIDEFGGATQVTIADLTKTRYRLLATEGTSTGDGGTVAPAQGEPSADVPAPDDSPAPESPSEAPAEPQHSGQSAPQSPQGDAPQAPSSAQHVAAGVAQATTEAQIATLYQQARDANFLTAEVSAMEGQGHFGIAPVRPGTEGSQTMALGELFNVLTARIDNATNAAASETPAPATEAPAPAPDAQSSASSPAPAPTPAEGTRTAAVIAQSADGADLATIEALVREAKAADLLGAEVEILGRKGPLGGFLESRLMRARRAESAQ